MKTHYCPRCKRDKSESEFYRRGPGSGKRAGQLMTPCFECANKLRTKWSHEHGESTPMAQSKFSPVYLGVYIAERILAKFFEKISRMPYGNPGYDFVCGKGFKIDVKSSVNRGGWWEFNIRKNQIADYFLCLAFDNRSALEPQHIWLIPSENVRSKDSIRIKNGVLSLGLWKEYEKPLDKVQYCCESMRE